MCIEHKWNVAVRSALHSTKLGHHEGATFKVNGRHKVCAIYENHQHPVFHASKMWLIEGGQKKNYGQPVKDKNMAKKAMMCGRSLFFVGYSS